MLARYVRAAPALAQAVIGDRITLDGLELHIPGSVAIRASVVAGNVRMRTIIDAIAQAGDTVVDVGANIGVIAAYAAARVGPSGRVIALEPASDNLAVLRENIEANSLANVTVIAAAAGSRRETRRLYVRGNVSAVNSLYPDSCYASVTGVASVDVVRLDDVTNEAALVKIDVEGAELEVLGGMPKLLSQPTVTVIVEWHPALQQAAGHAPDALPRWLIEAGFSLEAVGHVTARHLDARGIAALSARLLQRHRPVELLCRYNPAYA